MNSFEDIKENILTQAIEKDACKSQVERAKTCESWEQLQQVIADNIRWCIDNYIELPYGHYKSSRYDFTIVNGKVNGEFKDLRSNGQPCVHCTFKNGEKHGEYKQWHENGEPFIHCFYNDGKKDSEYKRWYSSGQPSVHSFYKDGKLHGEYKEWYENGQMESHCTFKDGEQNDKYYGYDGSGKPIVKKYYTKGKVNKFRTFIFKYFNI
jgi:hypothetical protein